MHEAATKVQATYRGHMTRKNLKAKAGEEGVQEVEAVEADSAELNEAATKVQATYRGHMTRKNLKAKAGEELSLIHI